MNSYQLLENIKQFRECLESFEDIEIKITEIADLENQIHLFNKKILAFSNLSSHQTQYILDFNSKIQSAKALIKQIGISDFFGFIAKMQAEIKAFTSEFISEVNELKTLSAQIDILKDTYEKFLQNNYHNNDALDFVYYANNVLRHINTVRSIFKDLELNLERNYTQADESNNLSLLLRTEHTYHDFVNKLLSLQELYSEICLLLNVSENDNPLKIVKIESGSLFVRIFGEPKVISTISSWIEETTKYFHRNYTKEGKISALPRDVEAIEKVLEVTQKLEAAGIEVDEVKEKLQKSSIIVAEKLNTLLSGEPDISINKEEYSMKASLEQQYITDSRIHLLQSGGKSNENS